MGSRFIKLFILFIFVVSATASCTTSESENAEGFEEELEGAEDVEAGAASAEAEETTEDAAAEESEEDTDDQKIADNATSEEKPDAEEAEDDEFLAEDSASPEEPAKEKLEEKDLQNELEKETIANKDPAVPAVESEPEAATAPPTTATVTPTPAEDPLMEAEVAAAAETTSATAPMSKDSSNDGFEVINPTVPQEDLGVSDPLVAEVDPPLPSVKAAQEVVPLSKINKDPFFRNERLMNTVYVVRPNEDLAIISQKIFNEDKTSILFSDNPHLSKGVEAGDKVYYNSPNRPDDKKTILTYFEDNKMSPQYYVTRKGDDIKKIGREVLGHEDGWKEIWATNESLQTQALLPSGLKVRYWSGTEPKSFESTNVASSESTTSVTGSITEKEPAPETLPEIPPSPEPMAALPTEDPGMAIAPPPTESVPMVASANDVPSVKPAESDSLLTIAAIAMIAMAGLGIVAIQIKNRRRDDGALPSSLEFTKV